MMNGSLPESEDSKSASARLQRDYFIALFIGLTSMVGFMIVFFHKPLLYFYGLCGQDARFLTVMGIACATGLALHYLARQRYGTSYFRVFCNALFPAMASDLPESKGHRRMSYATVDMFFVGGLILSCLTLLYHFNHTMDRSAPRHERVVVEDRFIESHKNSHDYFAKFKVPGQPGHHSAVRIKRAEYNAIVPGETIINLTIREGGLGMPWIEQADVMVNAPQAHISADTPRAQDTQAYREAIEWQVPASERVLDEGNRPLREEWPNGRVKQVEPTLNGQRHGLAHYWFDNGQSYAHIPWWHGEKHGRFKLYREDGTLEQNLSYRHGQPHGLNCWYDEQGRLVLKQVYVDGKALSLDGIQLPVCP